MRLACNQPDAALKGPNPIAQGKRSAALGTNRPHNTIQGPTGRNLNEPFPCVYSSSSTIRYMVGRNTMARGNSTIVIQQKTRAMMPRTPPVYSILYAFTIFSQRDAFVQPLRSLHETLVIVGDIMLCDEIVPGTCIRSFTPQHWRSQWHTVQSFSLMYSNG